MAPGSTQHLHQQSQQQSFDVTVGRPPTSTRPPAIDADEFIAKPGVARANAAVSASCPHGDRAYTERYKEHTVLQQHCLFWDRDGGGQIFPWDTYVGFRELGFNIIFSMLAMVIIHTGFSYPTRLGRSYVPDPLFRVYLDSIHKAKHGSDSGTYDTEGRFRPQQFEDMFAKYDGDRDGALTFRELFNLMSGNRNAMDPFGWGAAIFEFGTTYLLVQLDGKVYKEDLRGVYDNGTLADVYDGNKGSIFFRIRERRLRTKAGWNQGFGLGGDGFIGKEKSASLAALSL